MDINGPDLVTIGLLVALEGLLSADNALVMAIMVLGLPRFEHTQALRYGLIGGFAFRFLVVGQLIVLVQRYPALVDGAFIIIAWVGFKLGMEYLHDAHYLALEIPRWLSLGLIVVIFAIAFIYARMQGPVDTMDPLAEGAEHRLEAGAVDDTRRGGL